MCTICAPTKPRFPWPREFPAEMDIMRAQRSALSLGRLDQVKGVDLLSTDREIVIKAGRTTGITFGVVELSRFVKNTIGVAQSWEVYVHQCTSFGHFGATGDSGSAVINREGEIVGILSSGKTANNAAKPIAITPIQVIQADLWLAHKLKMELYRPDRAMSTLAELRKQKLPEVDSKEDATLIPDRLLQIEAGQDATILEMRHDKHQCLELRVESSLTKIPKWYSLHELHSDWNPAINVFLAQAQTLAAARSLPKLPKVKGSKVAAKEQPSE